MKFPVILYLLGAPGVGKTTLARVMLGWEVDPLFPGGRRFPRPDLKLLKSENGYKFTQQGTIFAAGHYTGEPFDGGDTVGYTHAIPTLQYWRDKLMSQSTVTILDGDRFSTTPSLEFLQAIPDLRIIGAHLVASPEVLAARRAAREKVMDAVQNAVWAKGRVTKAKNFAERIGATQLDAELPVGELYLRVSGMVFR